MHDTLVSWLRSLRRRRWRAFDVVIAVCLAYVATITVMRFWYAFVPWSLQWGMEGDWKQWIWQYHRYWTDGSFAPGHVVTDYQFRVQPPLYLLVMSALSHVMHPGAAARILSVIAWFGALIGAYRVSARLTSSWPMGLAAAVILAHDYNIARWSMGGYPRSFAPALVLFFIERWLARKHAHVLALLVVMAALYPSILVPCALAYGTVTACTSLRRGARAFASTLASLAAAGAACAVLSLWQTFRALDWWGPVVTLEEAQRMPALNAGGRMEWLPLGAAGAQIRAFLAQPFEPSGALAFFDVWPLSTTATTALGLLTLLTLLALALRRELLTAERCVPWELVAVAVAACASFIVARELAFRMYLPLRIVQHTLPYVVVVALPALAWQALRAHRHALGLSFALAVAPVFLVGGDGFLIPSWGDQRQRAGLLTFLREQTPVSSQVAGELTVLDVVPYFTARQTYVSWTMAHPFRRGFWDEMERRLRRNYDAIYAVDRGAVLRFLDEEHVDYLVLERARFSDADAGRSLFHPLRNDVLALFNERRPQGFALQQPPPSSVLYQDSLYVVVGAAELRQAWGPFRRIPRSHREPRRRFLRKASGPADTPGETVRTPRATPSE